MKLDDFYRHMVPFLCGETTPQALTEELGPTPSSPQRLLFYQHMMHANWTRIGSALFKATRAWMEGERVGSFADSVHAFRRAHPTAHWYLNQLGEGFDAFLTAQRPDAPWLGQLADYEWTRTVCARFDVAFDPAADAVNPTCVPRTYTHDVPRYTRAVINEEANATLQPTPITVLIYREPVSLRTRFIHLDLPKLVAFSAAVGQADPAAIAQTGVTADALGVAAKQLQQAGVLGPPGVVRVAEACR